uniref:Uncharacterized protein n=1 Tax=Anopheles quadriannulatus TaxID=34691 RepID=A0A182XQT4_ANOQN
MLAELHDVRSLPVVPIGRTACRRQDVPLANKRPTAAVLARPFRHRKDGRMPRPLTGHTAHPVHDQWHRGDPALATIGRHLRLHPGRPIIIQLYQLLTLGPLPRPIQHAANPATVVPQLHKRRVLLRITHGHFGVAQRSKRNDPLQFPASMPERYEPAARITIAHVRPIGVPGAKHPVVDGVREHLRVAGQTAGIVDGRHFRHAQTGGHLVELCVAPAGHFADLAIERDRIVLLRVETHR